MAGLEPANEGVKVPCLTAWPVSYTHLFSTGTETCTAGQKAVQGIFSWNEDEAGNCPVSYTHLP